MGTVIKKRWAGDPIRRRVGKGADIFLDDPGGWLFHRDHPMPTDRPVWVITEYQRRCVVQGGVFVRWAILDERSVFWHPMEIVDVQAPPDFPEGFRVEYAH